MDFWRRCLLLGVVLGVAALAGAASAATVTAEIDAAAQAKDQHGTLAFAAEELKQLGGKTAGSEPLVFRLAVDESLPPFAFSIQRDGGTIRLAGHTPAETLAAGYTALEQMGYRFDALGPIVPSKLDAAKVSGDKQVITPAIQRRGVRQHMNFADDLSAYPLNEAKAYIHNLARQRYNWITFHSYPGQWNRTRYNRVSGGGPWKKITAKHYKDNDYVKGCLFYGDHFAIPDLDPVRKTIRFNKSIFCIPELEPLYFEGAAREAFLTHWLRELMSECKRCGLGVQFSTEPQFFDELENEKILTFILEDYPQIDVLEIISHEGGGRVRGDFEPWFARQKAFMDDVLGMKDGAAADKKYPWKKTDEIAGQTRDLAMAFRAVRHLQAKGWDKQHQVQLAVGNYALEEKMVRAVVKFAEEYLPKDVWYTLMPGHSSRVVADNFVASQMSEQLLARTVLYSWLEFDGYMCLQQFACSGFIKALDQARQINGGKPMHGLVANHWRTGENFMSLRCLDELSFNSGLTQKSYVDSFAKAAGITDAAAFEKAMSEIDELSDLRAINGNIGFNIGWQIDPKTRGVGGLWWWSKDRNQKAADRFAAVVESLKKLKAGVADEQYARRLALLANRSEAAFCHLKAIRTLQETNAYFDYAKKRMPENLSAEAKARIVSICNEAQPYLDRYLQCLAEMPVDRSVEGFMLYYYRGPWLLGHNMRALYGGVGDFVPDAWNWSEFVPLPLSAKERDNGIEADKVKK